jgi:hypothetical protein
VAVGGSPHRGAHGGRDGSMDGISKTPRGGSGSSWWSTTRWQPCAHKGGYSSLSGAMVTPSRATCGEMQSEVVAVL